MCRPFALLGLAAALTLSACSATQVTMRADTAADRFAVRGDAERGHEVFSVNCAVCHGASGTEGGVGPSLRSERNRMDFTTTMSWIEDPAAPMPKLYPKMLTEDDVRDIASYVQTL